MRKSTILAEAAENLDMEAVARVAQKADLEEIYLVDAKVSRDPQNIAPEALSLEPTCSTKIVLIDKDNNILSVLCNFGLTAFNRKSPDKMFMSVEASFSTSYSLKPLGEFNPDDIEHFSKINPVYNAWPFWREFVQNMTTRMGFPALTIPLLKIMPKKSAKKEAESQPVKRKSPRRKKVDA